MKPHELYDQHYSEHYDKDYFAIISNSHKKVIQQLLEFPFTGNTALDIGCGTGNFLALLKRHFPDLGLWGLDPSEKMLDQSENKVSFSKMQGTIDDFRGVHTDQRFDLISSQYILAYESLEKILDFASDFLTDQGLLQIATTTLMNFPNMFQLCHFLGSENLQEMVLSPTSADDLVQRITAKGHFDMVRNDELVVPMPFNRQEELLDFVFHSGWLSGIALQYKDDIMDLSSQVPYPLEDQCISHLLLLRKTR